jgi:diadenosine tetraphosphate (Ap4A) HIT family hydrolase
MDTLIHRRVKLCRQGNFDQAVCRLSSGWLVMGDVQIFTGYCLLLPDPVVPNLNALDKDGRKTFLYEMSVVGDVLLELTDAVRINYEMLGNVEPALHAHIFPRYESEPAHLKLKPAWLYDWDAIEKFNLEQQKPFILKLKEGLEARKLVLYSQA